MENMVPITFLAGMFAWLIARRHYRTQEKLQLAAIKRGLPALPASTPRDPRRTAAVLMALGVGFALASHVCLSLIATTPIVQPLAISVWGIVPVLV